ncbi:MAG: ATP-binding protein [candidate division KSB1 bacterium]
MKPQLLQAERSEGPPRLLKIRFEKDAPVKELLAQFEAFCETNLREHEANVILDMSTMPYPTNNFIASLIATTFRARRLKGDLVLENLPTSARDNLITFSALNYLGLSVSARGTQALPVYQEPAPAAEEDFDATALVEITEHPLLQRLSTELKPESAPKPVPRGYVPEADMPSFSTRAESIAAKLYPLCDFVVGHAKQAGMKDKEIGKIRIAVYEACLNVIEHAYHSKPDNWIDLTVQYARNRFLIIIKDNGISSELKPAQDYDVQEAVNARKTGGFGLHIIRRAVDKVEYFPSEVHGNRLVLSKNLD